MSHDANKGTRALSLITLAVLAALLGGVLSVVVGKAAGWLAGSQTVVIGEVPADGEDRPAASPEATASRPLTGNGFDPAGLYRLRADGVVTLYATFDRGHPGPQSQGTGFVVSDEGYILTNSHVITTAGEGDVGAAARAAREVVVEFSDHDRITAEIVGWDAFSDVGVVRVDPDAHALQPVPLGDSTTVTVGQPVAAIGSPFGQTGSLSVGVVAAIERSIPSLTSGYDLVDVIQTDTPINRGNSGGPLFDSDGRVIGINSQIRSDSGVNEGVGFAVPINTAIRSMRQLIADGRVRYAWVGLVTQTLTPAAARRLGLGVQRGAAIQRVVNGSPASKAGFKTGGGDVDVDGIPYAKNGDVIVAIDDRPIDSSEAMIRVIASRLQPGQTARFTVVRGTKKVVVAVKLGERPASPTVG